MLDFEVKGVIFDLDDTILDNDPYKTGRNLHNSSRLSAAHAIGELHNLDCLLNLTENDNVEAYKTIKTHTIEAAVWSLMRKAKLVDTDEVDLNNKLLQEIVAMKHEIHGQQTLENSAEVVGAVDFINKLARNGLEKYMAIASHSIKRDIDSFLSKYELHKYFPDSHIKSTESVKNPKPDPEIFNLAFKSLDLTDSCRSQTCAFEDDPKGIIAARKAGLFVCAITTRFDKKYLQSLDVAPDIVADSYYEFCNIFNLNKSL